jgi:hypothetical protein
VKIAMESYPRELTVSEIVSEGVKIGLKNFASLIGAYFLWILTIWIPYLNVGTTIGLISIVVSMSKGEIISPTEIFKPQYRRYMGEFFLLIGFIYLGIILGLVFVVIPGIVIALAWSQAIYLMIDKGFGPLEAIKMSNKITYGKKWVIFFGIFLLSLILFVVDGLLSYVGTQISEAFGAILSFIGSLVIIPIILGGYAHIYRTLVIQINEPQGNQPIDPTPDKA